MSDDDINFPETPENILKEEFDLSCEIKSTTDFDSLSKFPLQMDITPQKVIEDDLNPYNLKDLEKKILINEFSDCDMYLKNIHKGFRHITSTNSLIKLVMAGIGVHKYRRQVLNDIKAETKATTLEFDQHGNLKS